MLETIKKLNSSRLSSPLPLLTFPLTSSNSAFSFHPPPPLRVCLTGQTLLFHTRCPIFLPCCTRKQLPRDFYDALVHACTYCIFWERERMNGRTDRQTGRHTDRQTHRQTNRQTDSLMLASSSKLVVSHIPKSLVPSPRTTAKEATYGSSTVRYMGHYIQAHNTVTRAVLPAQGYRTIKRYLTCRTT